PSGAAGSITSSTHAFWPSLVESMKDDTSGTIAPLAAGSGERTVRAQSQAMTVASVPSGNPAFGLMMPDALFRLVAHPFAVIAHILGEALRAFAVPGAAGL